MTAFDSPTSDRRDLRALALESASRSEGVRGALKTAVPSGLILTFLVCAFYYVYRYPLKINSTQTSATYRDTPLSLQLGKYVLLGVIGVAVLAWAWRALPYVVRMINLPEGLLLAFGAFTVARGVASWSYSGDTYILQRAAPIATIVPVTILGARWLATDPAARRFTRLALQAAAWLVIAHAVANLVQLALFELTGRMPALAYTGFGNRYGGLWDDPNGTAAYCAVIMVLALAGVLRLSPRLKLVVLAAGVFNLVLAWSYSGWLTLVAGVVVLGFFVVKSRAVHVAAVLGAVAIVTGLALSASAAKHWPVIGRMVTVKEGSATERFALQTHITPASRAAGWIIGSSPPPAIWLEDAFGVLISTVGVVGLGLFLAWYALNGFSIIRANGARWFVPLSACVVAGSAFIPNLVVFPLGTLLVVGVGLAAARVEPVRVPIPAPRLGAGFACVALLAIVGLVVVVPRAGWNKHAFGAESSIQATYWQGWSRGPAPGHPVVKTVASHYYAHSGSYAFEVHYDNSGLDPVGEYIWVDNAHSTSVQAGDRYLLRAFVSGIDTRVPVKLGVRYPSGEITNNGIRPIGHGLIKQNDKSDWALAGTLVVPPGVSRIAPALWAAGVPPKTSGGFFFDDVLLQKLSKHKSSRSAIGLPRTPGQ